MYSIVYWKKGERVNQRLAFYPVERKGFWENLSTRSSRLFSFQYTHGSGELVRWVPGIPPFGRYLSRQVPLTRSLYIGN